MKHNAKELQEITLFLEAVEKAVDKTTPKWKDAKPSLEGKFTDVNDSGSHEMENAQANYDKVKGKDNVKIDVDPTMTKVQGTAKGGATGVDGTGKPKEMKLESNSKVKNALKALHEAFNDVMEAFGDNEEAEEINEISTNMKKLSGRNPAINEEEKFMESLDPKKRATAKKLKEAIESLTGKKLVFKK